MELKICIFNVLPCYSYNYLRIKVKTDRILLSDEKFKLSFLRIQSIETNNGKTLAKTENCCGKLSVKLNNGEELLGNDYSECECNDI